MRTFRHIRPIGFLVLAGVVPAGPYAGPRSDPLKSDAAIPGFVGPEGDGASGLDGEPGEANRVNPLFFSWASQTVEYSRSDLGLGFDEPSWSLGPVTGDHFDVVSLGDLNSVQIAGGAQPGHITVALARPIADLPGADLAVFENGFSSENLIFGELAFVEVSSNGSDFARFPSRSLNLSPVSTYGTFDATNVFNLAGKHANGYGVSWGTPFDLSQLGSHPLVLAGDVDLTTITHVRVVDIPGTGQFFDGHVPPSPIYDPSVTTGSGGFDLEAIGGISVPVDFAAWVEAKAIPGAADAWLDDADEDGFSNALEFALGREPTRPENEPPVSVQIDSGFVMLDFTRDTRARGVALEVEQSSDLTEWKVIARSVDGGTMAAVAPFSPGFSEVSASPIASVGVVRRQTVRMMLSSGGTYFRLAVRPLPPP